MISQDRLKYESEKAVAQIQDEGFTGVEALHIAFAMGGQTALRLYHEDVERICSQGGRDLAKST